MLLWLAVLTFTVAISMVTNLTFVRGVVHVVVVGCIDFYCSYFHGYKLDICQRSGSCCCGWLY